MQGKNKGWKIAVIGAGVVGLSTVLQIEKQIPNSEVTIFAEKFLTETTSNGAAGIFRPGLNFCGPTHEITIKWLKDAYRFYYDFLRLNGPRDSLEAGIVERKVSLLSTKSPETVRNFLLEEVLPDFRILPQSEIRDRFPNTNYKHASTFTTLVIECKKYLPYLLNKFQKSGVKVVRRKIESFDEIGEGFDLIFNCTGLGSKKLCGDYKLTPIRGQVFKVYAPWVTEAVYLDTDTYIIPGTGGLVTLGGTRQFDSTNEEVDKYDAQGIWERCTSAVPSLKDAKVIEEWVGLRPYRPVVRVEKELHRLSNGKNIKVVHNYGHGGYGVMTSPGTSMHAVSLALEFINEPLTSKL